MRQQPDTSQSRSIPPWDSRLVIRFRTAIAVIALAGGFVALGAGFPRVMLFLGSYGILLGVISSWHEILGVTVGFLASTIGTLLAAMGSPIVGGPLILFGTATIIALLIDVGIPSLPVRS